MKLFRKYEFWVFLVIGFVLIGVGITQLAHADSVIYSYSLTPGNPTTAIVPSQSVQLDSVSEVPYIASENLNITSAVFRMTTFQQSADHLHFEIRNHAGSALIATSSDIIPYFPGVAQDCPYWGFDSYSYCVIGNIPTVPIIPTGTQLDFYVVYDSGADATLSIYRGTLRLDGVVTPPGSFVQTFPLSSSTIGSDFANFRYELSNLSPERFYRITTHLTTDDPDNSATYNKSFTNVFYNIGYSSVNFGVPITQNLYLSGFGSSTRWRTFSILSESTSSMTTGFFNFVWGNPFDFDVENSSSSDFAFVQNFVQPFLTDNNGYLVDDSGNYVDRQGNPTSTPVKALQYSWEIYQLEVCPNFDILSSSSVASILCGVSNLFKGGVNAGAVVVHTMMNYLGDLVSHTFPINIFSHIYNDFKAASMTATSTVSSTLIIGGSSDKHIFWGKSFDIITPQATNALGGIGDKFRDFMDYVMYIITGGIMITATIGLILALKNHDKNQS